MYYGIQGLLQVLHIDYDDFCCIIFHILDVLLTVQGCSSHRTKQCMDLLHLTPDGCLLVEIFELVIRIRNLDDLNRRHSLSSIRAILLSAR